MFDADTIDDLTIEQYNVLIELWNDRAGSKIDKMSPRTTSIVSVAGKRGVNYGEED
jgi:hypothetical protein